VEARNAGRFTGRNAGRPVALSGGVLVEVARVPHLLVERDELLVGDSRDSGAVANAPVLSRTRTPSSASRSGVERSDTAMRTDGQTGDNTVRVTIVTRRS
jgi:hypothetical protein